MRSKKPGSLSTATEPRVIWLAMITRPRVTDPHLISIYNKTGKFNRALEDSVAMHRYHHIMYLENVDQSPHFDTLGKLTAKGKTEMWHEIIHQIKRFNMEEIHLKPKQKVASRYRTAAAGDMS